MNRSFVAWQLRSEFDEFQCNIKDNKIRNKYIENKMVKKLLVIHLSYTEHIKQ